MDPEDIAWLRSEAGVFACMEATALLDAGRSELAVLDTLRRAIHPEHTRAVLALIEGRRSAAGKFADAGRLFFDRESAEQSTSETVARHTAARCGGSNRSGLSHG